MHDFSVVAYEPTTMEGEVSCKRYEPSEGWSGEAIKMSDPPHF